MSGGWSCPATHSFYVHPHSSLTSLCLLQNEKREERERASAQTGTSTSERAIDGEQAAEKWQRCGDRHQTECRQFLLRRQTLCRRCRRLCHCRRRRSGTGEIPKVVFCLGSPQPILIHYPTH